MISFYPGPSKVVEKVPQYVREAYREGILSANHRSPQFMQLCEQTIALLKEKLEIPNEYKVVFTSSATECWEIIAQSLISTISYHFYNGAFGEKWFNYTKKLGKNAIGYRFDKEYELKIKELDLSGDNGVICITQNETSNGTQVKNELIKKVRKQYPEHMIAIDATSSLGGIALDFSNGDVWFASVQKCLGLPAGLGILICSPQALEVNGLINENNHYNSLGFMIENIKKYQTPYTPNVLNIYLLNRMLADRKPIKDIHRKIVKRFSTYCENIDQHPNLKHYIKNENVRSYTVLTLQTSQNISQLKEDALAAGLVLGNGYGELKDSTFRIANFPALRNKEVKLMRDFLMNSEVYSPKTS